MNKHYVLTPMSEIPAEHGNERVYTMYESTVRSASLAKVTHYLRPITDGIVISEEEFVNVINEVLDDLLVAGFIIVDRKAYINSIIKKYKDNGK